MRIAVAGAGYVGLSMATLLSTMHSVIAVDILEARVAMINQRQSPIADKEIQNYFQNKELDLVAEIDSDQVYQNADFDPKKAERGIIYIDEIDKIARKSENTSTAGATAMVAHGVVPFFGC